MASTSGSSSTVTSDSGSRALQFEEHFKPKIVELGIDQDTLIKEMECSFCKSTVPAPLEWRCMVGHIICVECSGIIPRCPYEPPGSTDARNMCRKRFVQTRMPLYDRLYNTSLFQCAFRSYGCTDLVTGAEFRQHCKECRFRPPDTDE